MHPPARRARAALLRPRAPQCLVLSIAELPATQPVEVVAVIGGAQPQLEGSRAPQAFEEEVMAA